MNRIRVSVAILIGCVFLSSVGTARAQRQRSRPTRPAISDYFNLYRGEPGPLGPYHSDFRPRQQVRRNLQKQAFRLQQQNTQIRALDQRMSLSGGSRGVMRPTGTGSMFMNYSHYYQMGYRSSGGRR